MSPLTALQMLRRQLSSLYTSVGTLRVLLADVGLADERINFSGTIVEVWHSALCEAHHQNKVESIVDYAKAAYPLRVGELEVAYQPYRQAVAPVTAVSAPGANAQTLADYDSPRAAFAALCQPACDRRILLLRGTSGSGKTTLLTYCQQESATPTLSIQLRGGTVGVAEIFARAARRLTWDCLPRFAHQVERLQGAEIDGNALLGINNRITVALHAENPADREERRTLLTDAWFDDVAALEQPLLVIFDTYEQAATEVQEWLSGPFLVRVADTAPVRVVVAGQQTPEAHNIEWSHCCRLEELYGVAEARHWLPVVEALHRYIPARDPESWLAGICHVYRGHPDDIIKVIKGLPLREAHR